MKTISLEEGYPLALLSTYLAMIVDSDGCQMFQRLYVQTPEGPKDVIGDGDLACSFFVSSLLTLCGLIQGGVHTTVNETEKDMIASGWVEIEKPRPGAVIVWESKLCDDGLMHRHIGFAISSEAALSNISERRMPGFHLMTFGEKNRLVEKVYFHPSLES